MNAHHFREERNCRHRMRCPLQPLGALLITLLLLLTGSPGWAQNRSAEPVLETTDSTLAPYFYVPTDDSAVDLLPLKSTRASATIAGVIAEVQVTQVYENTGRFPIEAIYVFPASTRAAVSGLTMTIGERVITADIRERKKAREEYEAAKGRGQSASLLEQERPNVFRMNVANILPGDLITVQLNYTELLVPTAATYRFVYPTVVGPRYAGSGHPGNNGSTDWVANPYLQEGEAPPYRFDMEVRLLAAMPIQDIRCPSHRVDVTYEDQDRALVRLKPEETAGGNRDFILEYRLAGSRIQSGILLEKGEKENFFLLQLEPPGRVGPEQITPREYIFVVDVSGSMYGFPLNTAKQLMQDLVGGLNPNDRFNILLFAGGSSLLAEKSLAATPANIRKGIDFLSRRQGGGGTELLPALQRALALPSFPGMSRSFVLITDGYVTVERQVFELIRENLDRANVFAFGIGSSVNRYLIEGMARAGRGEPFVVTKPAEAKIRARQFRAMISAPVAAHIGLDFGSFQVHDVEPESIPDLFAERPIVVIGKWTGKPAGTITIHAETARGVYTKKVALSSATLYRSKQALRYLWARTRIACLADYRRVDADSQLAAAITRLGLTYGLLTDYTSFVAIDRQVRREGGKTATVTQPLPLPAGVSNHAVGRSKMLATLAMPGVPAAAAKAPAPSYGEASGSPLRELDALAADEKAKGRVQIRIVRIRTRGALQEAQVRKVLESALEAGLNCLQQGGPSLSSRSIRLVITIDGNGRIQEAQRPASKTALHRLETCIRNVLKPCRFPAQEAGQETTVEIELRIDAARS